MVVASIHEKDSLQILNVEERQALKDSEDLLIDNLLILDATFDTIASLLKNYQSYCHDCRKRSPEISTDDIDLVIVALEEHQREVSLSRRKIETLHRKVRGSIHLVRQPRPHLRTSLDLATNGGLSYLVF